MLVKGQRLCTVLAAQGLRICLALSWSELVLTIARWSSNHCLACPRKYHGESLTPYSSRETERSPLCQLRLGEALGQLSKRELATDENKAGYSKTYKNSPKWTKIKQEASPTTNTVIPAVEGRECWRLLGNAPACLPFCFHPHNPEEHWTGESNTKKG